MRVLRFMEQMLPATATGGSGDCNSCRRWWLWIRPTTSTKCWLRPRLTVTVPGHQVRLLIKLKPAAGARQLLARARGGGGGARRVLQTAPTSRRRSGIALGASPAPFQRECWAWEAGVQVG